MARSAVGAVADLNTQCHGSPEGKDVVWSGIAICEHDELQQGRQMNAGELRRFKT